MKRTLLIVAIAACTTSNEPFALDHAQILAVRSEPAHAPVGGTVRVDVLAGDDAGNVFVTVPDSLDAGGLPAVRRADGWYVTGPVQLAPTIAVTVAIDGTTWAASKELVFGDAAANPTLASDAALDMTKGEKRELDVTATGADPFTYAWYASVGTLDHYRSAQATFSASVAGEGTVCVVVRDAQGGVAWQMLPATIQ
jgi:hypothetical protein